MESSKFLRETIFLTLVWVTISAKMRVVDLSYEVGEKSIVWPGNPKLNLTTLFKGYDGEFWYEQYYFGTTDHISTHLDAPAHFGKGKWHTHEIPIDRLIGPGVIINVKEKVKQNPDYRASIRDILSWEKKYGRIPDKAIVILNTGWSSRHPSENEVFGSNTPTNFSTIHFPSWRGESVLWLTRNRRINVLGTDTPSTDYGQSTKFPVHRILAKQNIPGLENVANLDRIPPYGSTVIIGVIKLKHGSGGPARVIAISSKRDD